jgi:hypothetical protein
MDADASGTDAPASRSRCSSSSAREAPIVGSRLTSVANADEGRCSTVIGVWATIVADRGPRSITAISPK